MRVGIATDHGGFSLKEELVVKLRAAGHEVVDFGAHRSNIGDDYPDYVVPLAQTVVAGSPKCIRSLATWWRRRPNAVASTGTREAAPLNSWVKSAQPGETAVSVARMKASKLLRSSAGSQHVSMNVRCPLAR
jgi:Ribose/Galactose Isomerase